MVKPERYKLQVAGIDKMNGTLQRMEEDQHRTNALLAEMNELLGAIFQRGSDVADDLADVRDNLQELGVDVDLALNEIGSLRTQVDEALANAGVDQAARDQVNQAIDAIQQRVRDALNPAVPVDPNTPPADLGGTEGQPTG